MTIRGMVAALLCRRLEINSLFVCFFSLPILIIHERSLGVKVQIPKFAAVELFALTGRSRTEDWCCSQWTPESTRVPLYTFLCAMSI